MATKNAKIANGNSVATGKKFSYKELLAKAPRGKEGKEVLDAITSELAVLETTVGEVSAQLASGDLLGAQSKVNAAKEKAMSIKTELETAIAKKAGKK